MKTWTTATQAHSERVAWCSTFREILAVLEDAGCPAPDDMGAAHCRWAATYGVVQVSLSVGDQVALSAHRLARGRPVCRLIKRDQLGEVVEAWVEFIIAQRQGELSVVFADKPVGDEPLAIEPETATELVARRVEPYWQP